MAEYWKSLPRKYCEACKCWFADNKSSIDFHERGKRHQENVAKRISEIRKKGQKEYEAKLKYDADMKKIEAAALKAFQNDIKNDPKLAQNFTINVNTVKPEPDLNKPTCNQSKATPHFVPPVKVKQEKASKPSRGNLQWFEAKTPEGYSYYYNSETGQSQWEAPSEGFVPVSQIRVKQEQGSSSSCSFGPKPRHEPYGQWAPVVEPKKETIDLQLPEKREMVEINIPLHPDEPPIEFKEKTVSSIGDSCEGNTVQFKKRKNIGDHKRNVRSRTDD